MTVKTVAAKCAVTACAATAGLLAVHAPAQAQPQIPLPLAPACNQFIFSGPVEIRSALQTIVTFTASGASTNHPAKYSGAGLPAVDATVKGSITGDAIALSLTSTDPGV